jgi:hypothetical protein
MVYTNTGRNELVSWLNGSAATAPTHMAWGTGTTTPTKADTALATETVRNALTSKLPGSQEIQFEGILTSAQGNGTTIAETGLFNAGAAGDLFARQTFAGIAKTLALEIQTTVILTLT